VAKLSGYVPLLSALAMAACASEPATPVAEPSDALPVSAYGGPPARRIAFDSLAPSNVLTIGMLHHSLDGFDLAPEDLEVRVSCIFLASEGRLIQCQSLDGKVPYAVPSSAGSPIKAAIMRAMQMRFERVELPPGADSRLVVEVPVKLSPADRATVGMPVNVRKASEVDWRHAPPSDNLFLWFPLSALTQPATLTTTCQIQPDLSLVCSRSNVEPASEPIESSNPFMFAADHAAGPVLKDGSPAAGTWVAIEYILKPTPILVAPRRL
jgi:hypothetical protein